MKKRIAMSAIMLSIAFVACGPVNNADASSDASSNTSVAATPTMTSLQNDAKTYSDAVNPLLTQYMTLRDQFNQFISDFNAGHCTSAQTMSTVTSINVQTEEILTKAQLVQAPDSLATTHQIFVKGLTDFANAQLGVEDVAAHGQSKERNDNINTYFNRSKDEMKQFMDALENAMK